jgi:hypothetical protein
MSWRSCGLVRAKAGTAAWAAFIFGVGLRDVGLSIFA